MADEYATADELDEHVSASLLVGVTDAIKLKHIERHSRVLDDVLKDRGYSVPLTAPIPESVKLAILRKAAWSLLVFRGANPEDPSHAALRLDAQDAQKWYDEVAAGRWNLAGAASARTPSQVASIISGSGLCPGEERST